MIEYQIDDNEIELEDDAFDDNESDEIFIEKSSLENENARRLRNRYAIEEILEKKRRRYEGDDDDFDSLF